MRVFQYSHTSSALHRGEQHGECFRHEIQSLAAIRIYLTQKVGRYSAAREVLAAAERHLPVLRSYDQDLYEELLGVAKGANLSAAEIVVLNHYTDLRDLYSSAATSADADGCSLFLVSTASGRILAQTWDMHASAMPYVMMLRTPEAWLLSLTGCLGMAGLNSSGLAVGINNLHSTDARVGLVWPALVRRLLREKTAAQARDLVLSSPLGSGHHYVVADPHQAYGIETSGTVRKLVYEGGQAPYIHTNHALDPEVAAKSRIPPQSTTEDRFHWLETSLAAEPVRDPKDAWRRLGSVEGYPRSVCTNLATPLNPHGTATCAGIAMDLDRVEVRAAAGLTHHVDPDVFRFDGAY